MANAKPKYFLVEATALPEVFVKVTEAKSLWKRARPERLQKLSSVLI